MTEFDFNSGFKPLNPLRLCCHLYCVLMQPCSVTVVRRWNTKPALSDLSILEKLPSKLWAKDLNRGGKCTLKFNQLNADKSHAVGTPPPFLTTGCGGGCNTTDLH